MSFELMAKAIDVNGLSSTEKFIFIMLCNYADDQGRCFPKIDTISKKCATSQRTVNRAVLKLVENGFLEKQNRFTNGMQTSNLYTVHFPDNSEETQQNKVRQNDVAVRHSDVAVRHSDGVGVTQCRGGGDTVSHKPINEPINNLPPIVPQGTEWVEGTLAEFYQHDSCDSFREICTARAVKKGMSIERADQEFEKFEKFWLSPAAPKSKAKKKDWKMAFSRWISNAKFEPAKKTNSKVAADMHRNAMEDDEIRRALAIGDQRLESDLPFLRALNKGYTREEISKVVYQVCENPPKSKIYSWGIINEYFT